MARGGNGGLLAVQVQGQSVSLIETLLKWYEENAALMANWSQASLIINGTCPPVCFFSRLAAFFSLGVSADCFFDSLLLRWVFDIVVAPGPNWACTAAVGVGDYSLGPAFPADLNAGLL